MGISLIAAMARGNVIGGDNTMLWHLSGDFAYFKDVTMGKPILMGRKTFESIGRPLSGRTNIVITRNTDFCADGTVCVASVNDALQVARGDNTDIMVIGGGDMYAQTIHIADTLYITEVDMDINGDTVFPVIDGDMWYKHSVSDDRVENDITYRFVVYKRT